MAFGGQGIVKYIRILIDEATKNETVKRAEQIGRDVADRLADKSRVRSNGDRIAAEFAMALKAQLDKERADIQNKVAQGFMNPQAAKQAGAQAAIAYNQGIQSVMRNLRPTVGLPNGVSPATLQALQGSMVAVPQVGAAAKQVGVLGQALSSLAGKVAVLFGARSLIRFGRESYEEALKAEAGWQRLAQTMSNFGVSFDKEGGRLFEMQQNMGKTLGVTQEQFTTILQFLMVQTGNYEKSLRGVTTALNLMVARHMTAEMAARVVGRVIVGNVESLTRYGISLDKTRDGLEQLEKQLGGEKESWSRTMAGRLKVLAFWWNELKLAIGYALEESGAGTNLMQNLIDAIQGLTTWVQRNHKELRDFGKELADIVRIVSKLIGWGDKLRQWFLIAAEGFQKLGLIIHERFRLAIGGVLEDLADFLSSPLRLLPDDIGKKLMDKMGLTAMQEHGRKMKDDARRNIDQIKQDLTDFAFFLQNNPGVPNKPRVTGSFPLGNEGGIDLRKNTLVSDLREEINLLEKAVEKEETRERAKTRLLAIEEQLTREITKAQRARDLKQEFALRDLMTKAQEAMVADVKKENEEREKATREAVRQANTISEMAEVWQTREEAIKRAAGAQALLNDLLEDERLTDQQRLDLLRAQERLVKSISDAYQGKDFNRRIQEASLLLRGKSTRGQGIEEMRQIREQLATVDQTNLSPKERQEIRMQLARVDAILRLYPLQAKPWIRDIRETLTENLPSMAEGAAKGMADAFSWAFDRIISDSRNVKGALNGLAKGLAASLLAELAAMSRGKVAENIAWAIEETAKGFATLGTPASGKHFAAAGTFAKAALAWGLVSGVTGNLSRQASTAAGNAGVGSDRNVGGRAAENGKQGAPNVYVFVDGVDPKNGRHQVLVGETVREYRERYGGNVIVTGR